ncbi:terminal nucleotidyltransferase 4B-like [Acropora millepora]|uniref:terminal nucleotidyltransferase 4B-like n=1 Tax=Acropora millepora TaxID=45264 RepID=UPI001CF3EBC5|nr:terminal nucleotidyltransferase 4B-like [Acropora millepora]
MLSPLMMASRMGWIQQEQNGPTFETWSDVLGDVDSPSTKPGNVYDEMANYIPLNRKNNLHENVESTTFRNMINEGKNRVSKKKKIEDGTPWWSKDKKYPDGPVGLHEEMCDFYNFMKPRQEEHAMRQEVISRIQKVVKGLWPTAEVEVFGSYRTGLYLPTSDIDIVIFGKWERLPLWTLEQALTANKIAEASTIKVLDKASVPIIKLTDQVTKVKLDISFNTPDGLKAADFVKDQMEIFPCLPPLVLVLKQFLVQRDLNEVFAGGISSHSLVLMIISFLQQHPRKDGRTLKSNLGVLLIEFFELYGKHFNYEDVGIRVKDRGSYFNKQEAFHGMDGNSPDNYCAPLCIEDPTTEGNYLGKSSYKFLDVVHSFSYAYGMLSKSIEYDVTTDRTNPGVTKERDSVGYLGQIVRVKSETLEYREWVASVWSVDSAPLIKQSAPTYASIANRHVQTHAITSQDSSYKNATWNRSQSNLETLMTEGKGEPFVKHASVDCLSVRGMSSVQNSADSLAQDMIPEKIAAYETRTSVFGGSSKSLNFQPANNNELSCPSKGSLYSEAIKQSPTKTKQTFTSMPKTSAVTSTSKSKLTAKSSRSSVSDVTHMVKTVSSSARSSTKTCFSDPISKAKVSCDSGLTLSKTNFVDSVTKTKERDLQKTVDEQKSSPTSNSNNTVVCVPPKLDLNPASQLRKDNGIGKQSSTITVSTPTKDNISNCQNNNITVSKDPTKRKHGRPTKCKKEKSS